MKDSILKQNYFESNYVIGLRLLFECNKILIVINVSLDLFKINSSCYINKISIIRKVLQCDQTLFAFLHTRTI